MYFVEYINRKGVGAATDYIVLMGYDQRGAWSSQAGSIAEVSWVEENINSLIEDSKIPSNKIILGIPFYTRLWTENTSTQKLTTKVYTMKNCEEFIQKYKLNPVWDEDAGQNYVEYTEGDLKYKLWIEDANSVKKRVELISKYNLAGITGWRKGFETSDIWKVIKDNIK
jgi:spore germination protein YaaH